MRPAVPPEFAVVIPTVGRSSLETLLQCLAQQRGPLPVEVVVIDDRKARDGPLVLPRQLTERVRVRALPSLGRGPAAARNLGWRVTTAEWAAFLDDDVEVRPEWSTQLVHDLSGVAESVAGVQGALEVPPPRGRRPTDWERSTAGLTTSVWITADMAYRRVALVQARGFDERFRRAYREDADLGARLTSMGWSMAKGSRIGRHPVRAQPGWNASLSAQRGNADDALLRNVFGRHWRARTRVGRGRLPWHVATVVSAALAASGAATTVRRGRRGVPIACAAAGMAAWLGLTTDFAARRIAPGPRDSREVARMLVTSALIPPAAVAHRLRGEWIHRGARAWPPPVRGVLLDRDGTLVEDVPYNGHPALVGPLPHVVDALKALRDNHIRVGVITNQSAVGRGLISPEQMEAVNAEIERRLGPFQTWQVCPHTADDGCACRKPSPGMVLAGARDLGLHVSECVVVGDIGSDLLAARGAGARSILVPTAETKPQEVADAPVVATDLLAAAELILDGAA